MSLRLSTALALAFAVGSNTAVEDVVGRNVTTGKSAVKSAAEKKKMEAAGKKGKVMDAKVAELKKQEAAIKKESTHHTAKAHQADEKIKSLKKASAAKKSKCIVGPGPASPNVNVTKNVKKAQAAADDEAGKRSKKEHDAIVGHAKDTALKTSKALLAEEHAALHGKLMKEILKIATGEAAKYAPKAAKREVGVLHKKIAADVQQQVYVLVKKDATVVARALAMKEVQDQADKSGKVKKLVASVAKEAAKYFAHKFSKTEVTKLAGEEAAKHVKAKVQNHTEIEIGKAQAAAKAKMVAAHSKIAAKQKKDQTKAAVPNAAPKAAAPKAAPGDDHGDDHHDDDHHDDAHDDHHLEAAAAPKVAAPNVAAPKVAAPKVAAKKSLIEEMVEEDAEAMVEEDEQEMAEEDAEEMIEEDEEAMVEEDEEEIGEEDAEAMVEEDEEEIGEEDAEAMVEEDEEEIGEEDAEEMVEEDEDN